MHHKYNTEAFILKSLSHKDANKIYFLFTEEFGLVRAIATGVRLLKSKLRYHLSDFNYVSISLVRGKEYWRIVGVDHPVNFSKNKKISQETLSFYGKIFSLILRLVHGEEKNRELFLAIKGSFLKAREKDMVSGLEYLSVARIMRSLGYLKTEGFEKLFRNYDYDEEVITFAESMCKEIITEINQSLNETHL